MISGSISGFVDVVRNFNTAELLDDSLVRQWVSEARNIVMFGDVGSRIVRLLDSQS